MRFLCCLILCSLVTITSACSEPAEELATHFEAMATTAEKGCECPQKKTPELSLSGPALDDHLAKNPRKCTAIGAALADYLESNKDAMRALASQVGESEPATAQRIYSAARRLDNFTQACGADENIATFKHDLSKLVRESALAAP